MSAGKAWRLQHASMEVHRGDAWQCKCRNHQKRPDQKSGLKKVAGGQASLLVGRLMGARPPPIESTKYPKCPCIVTSHQHSVSRVRLPSKHGDPCARDIAVYGDRSLAQFRRGRVSRVRIKIRNDHAGAGGQEAPHNGCANACALLSMAAQEAQGISQDGKLTTGWKQGT